MRRLPAILALIAMPAAFAGTATAAPASALPDAKTLATAGLAVGWPLRSASTTATPGSRLVVTVRRTGAAARHRRAARLSLIRRAGGGRPASTLASMALRSGRFAVRLPATRGVGYTLRLRLGTRMFDSRIEVAAAAEAPAPSAAAPTAPAPPAPPTADQPAPPAPAVPGTPVPYGDDVVLVICDGPLRGPFEMDATLDKAVAVPGDRVTLTVHNRDRCFAHPLGDDLERQLPDGTWQPVGDPGVIPSITRHFELGETETVVEEIPADAPLGVYRIRTESYAGTAPLPTFDVVAP